MRNEISLWIKKARNDIEAAKILAKAGKLDSAAFHLQQSVEKALKAVYISIHRESPGTTHSLLFLANRTGYKGNRETLKLLTASYFSSRYPDANGMDEYTEDEIKSYMSEAEKVLEWAEEKLGMRK